MASFSPKSINFDQIEEGVNKSIGEQLAYHRKIVGCSQVYLAKALDMSVAQYKKYENGSDELRAHVSIKWSLIMGMPSDKLLVNSAYSHTLPAQYLDSRLDPFYSLIGHLDNQTFNACIEMLATVTDYKSDINEVKKAQCPDEYFDLALDDVDGAYYQCISKMFKIVREKIGISQERMAELLGVSLSSYIDYENEDIQRKFSFVLAARFWQALNITPMIMICDTHIFSIRKQQDSRLDWVEKFVNSLSHEQYQLILPLLAQYQKLAKLSKTHRISNISL